MSWKVFFDGLVKSASMNTREIPATAMRVWGIHEGNLCRPDGAFFSVAGLTIFMGNPEEREVPNWDQPIIKEKGVGVVGLIKAKGEERFLVQFKAEPGNATAGHLQANCALSASESNMNAAHGGKRPPFAQCADNIKVAWYPVPQDGGRFLGKVNKYAVIEVDSANLDILPNCYWATREECLEMMAEGLMSSHMLEAFGVYYLSR